MLLIVDNAYLLFLDGYSNFTNPIYNVLLFYHLKPLPVKNCIPHFTTHHVMSEQAEDIHFTFSPSYALNK